MKMKVDGYYKEVYNCRLNYIRVHIYKVSTLKVTTYSIGL